MLLFHDAIEIPDRVVATIPIKVPIRSYACIILEYIYSRLFAVECLQRVAILGIDIQFVLDQVIHRVHFLCVSFMSAFKNKMELLILCYLHKGLGSFL